MAAPIVSVVMSVYNLRYLRESVESILSQSFTDFEFVIVDDSCADGTWVLLVDLAANDSRVRLLRNEHNLGQTQSLNLGFAAAQGQFIARQDDDDISLRQRLEQQVAFMQTHLEVGLLGTQMQLINVEGRPFDQPTHYPLDNGDLQNQLMIHCCFCHGAVMLRRSWLDLEALYDPSYKPADDYELWLRLAEHMQLANLPQMLYQFRQHDGSTSRQRRHIQLFNAARAREQAVERRLGAGAAPDRFEATAHHYLEATIASHIAGEISLVERSLAIALQRYPSLLDRAEPLRHYLISFTYDDPPEASLNWLRSLFNNVLPNTPRLKNLYSQILSDLYMREVFEGVARQDVQRIDSHLLAGLLSGPGWLLNKGVVSIAIKSLARRATRFRKSTR